MMPNPTAMFHEPRAATGAVNWKRKGQNPRKTDQHESEHYGFKPHRVVVALGERTCRSAGVLRSLCHAYESNLHSELSLSKAQGLDC